MPISFLLLVRLVDKIPFAFIGLLPQLGSFLFVWILRCLSQRLWAMPAQN
jgi:hypothetical protein